MVLAASAVRLDPHHQPRVATARVFNETAWPILVVAHGGQTTDLIAPGEDAALSLPLASNRALTVSGHGHRRVYALDFDLLGFDTVHVRAGDLMPVAMR